MFLVSLLIQSVLCLTSDLSRQAKWVLPDSTFRGGLGDKYQVTFNSLSLSLSLSLSVFSLSVSDSLSLSYRLI